MSSRMKSKRGAPPSLGDLVERGDLTEEEAGGSRSIRDFIDVGLILQAVLWRPTESFEGVEEFAQISALDPVTERELSIVSFSEPVNRVLKALEGKNLFPVQVKVVQKGRAICLE